MRKFTPKLLNIFLMFKLPSAFISGIRVTSISDQQATAKVHHKWINQNPFKSLYWAVQGMASELVTGILVMKRIDESGKSISMLVINQSGTFTKKATGRINFICNDGDRVKQAIDQTIETGEGQNLIMMAEGFDEDNESVSKFEYEWSPKVKN
jgi:hypothetical protein